MKPEKVNSLYCQTQHLAGVLMRTYNGGKVTPSSIFMNQIWDEIVLYNMLVALALCWCSSHLYWYFLWQFNFVCIENVLVIREKKRIFMLEKSCRNYCNYFGIVKTEMCKCTKIDKTFTMLLSIICSQLVSTIRDLQRFYFS